MKPRYRILWSYGGDDYYIINVSNNILYYPRGKSWAIIKDDRILQDMVIGLFNLSKL